MWYQYWTYNHHSVNKKQTTVQLFFYDLPKNPANTVLKDGQYLVRGLLAWEHHGKGLKKKKKVELWNYKMDFTLGIWFR